MGCQVHSYIVHSHNPKISSYSFTNKHQMSLRRAGSVTVMLNSNLWMLALLGFGQSRLILMLCTEMELAMGRRGVAQVGLWCQVER